MEQSSAQILHWRENESAIQNKFISLTNNISSCIHERNPSLAGKEGWVSGHQRQQLLVDLSEGFTSFGIAGVTSGIGHMRLFKRQLWQKFGQ